MDEWKDTGLFLCFFSFLAFTPHRWRKQSKFLGLCSEFYSGLTWESAILPAIALFGLSSIYSIEATLCFYGILLLKICRYGSCSHPGLNHIVSQVPMLSLVVPLLKTIFRRFTKLTEFNWNCAIIHTSSTRLDVEHAGSWTITLNLFCS